MVWSISRSRLRSEPAAPHSRSSWNCSIWKVKPRPSWPIRLRLRHAHVVEEQLRGVAAVHADLVDLLPRDAGRVHRHHDQALVLVRRAVAGVGQQAAPVGLHAVGDPHLAAVDDVVAAIAARRGLHRRHVAAAAGLADAQAGDHVAGDRRRQELACAARRCRSAPAPAWPCRSARRWPSARRRSCTGPAPRPSPCCS